MDTERWAVCDQRAIECPEDPEIVGSLETLAKYLTEPFETDVEKHRVIFRWVADHVSLRRDESPASHAVVLVAWSSYSDASYRILSLCH